MNDIINWFPEALSILVPSHRMVYWIRPMAHEDIMQGHIVTSHEKKRMQHWRFSQVLHEKDEDKKIT